MRLFVSEKNKKLLHTRIKKFTMHLKNINMPFINTERPR